MVARSHPVHSTFAEYLAHESASNVKHEFLDGHIYAMAGGTPEHAALIFALGRILGNQLQGGRCRVYVSDLRVRVQATGLTTYPDLSVVCGPWQRDAEDKNTVLNPTVIAEVLSKGTEAYDRGEKFEHYQLIPSLRAYVLVAQDRRQVELWSRADDGVWSAAVAGAGGVAELSAVGARVQVDGLYDDAREPEA